LAKSISRPGGNVTGAQMLTGLSQKRLQLLKQAFPDAEHIAVLANPKDEISVSEMPTAEMAAAQMVVHLIPFVAIPAYAIKPHVRRGRRRPHGRHFVAGEKAEFCRHSRG
jgi:ABC-type uncharacterized transport system substrate-binding protein